MLHLLILGQCNLIEKDFQKEQSALTKLVRTCVRYESVQASIIQQHWN